MPSILLLLVCFVARVSSFYLGWPEMSILLPLLLSSWDHQCTPLCPTSSLPLLVKLLKPILMTTSNPNYFPKTIPLPYKFENCFTWTFGGYIKITVVNFGEFWQMGWSRQGWKARW
jgi:hypothetical protein